MFVISKLFVLILLTGTLVVFLQTPTAAQARTIKSIPTDEPTVIEGPEVRLALAKYMVSVRIGDYTFVFGDNHRCAGALISPAIVLTAAHCTFHPNLGVQVNTSQLYVVVGSSNRFDDETSKTVEVEKYFVHDLYNMENFKHNIAILHLAQELKEDNKTVQSIPLTGDSPKEGTPCTVSGWGRILSKGPLAAEVVYDHVQIIHQKTCLSYFAKRFANSIVCANNKKDKIAEKGMCFGDFGGPLICDGVLVGIASLGSVNGCSAVGFPDGFLNIWNYREWILNTASRRKVACSLFVVVGFWMVNSYFC